MTRSLRKRMPFIWVQWRKRKPFREAASGFPFTRKTNSLPGTIQLVTPGEDISCPVREMYDEHLNPIDSCPHPEQLVYITISEMTGHSPAEIPVGSLLRKTYAQ